MKEIEIPFGAKDSELKGWEYTIPEGMEAEIKDGKIIVREKESEDERMINELQGFLDSFGADYFGTGEWQKFHDWLEKYKESLHISESCKESADSFTDACKDVIVAIEKYLDWLTGYPDYAPKGKYSLRDMLHCLSLLEKQKEHQFCSDAPKEKSVGGIFLSSHKDKNIDELSQEYVDGVKQYNQEPTWDLMQTAVCYGYHLAEQKEQQPVEWKPQPESLEALMYAIEGKWEAIKPTSYLSRRLEDLYEGLVNTYNVDESLLDELPKVASRAYTAEDIEELKELKNKIEASMDKKPVARENAFVSKPEEWSENDKRILDEAINMLEARGGWVRSEDAVEKVSNFLKFLPERFNLQPKQEWSEENKIDIELLISLLRGKVNLAEILESRRASIIDFLKSLRPQSQEEIYQAAKHDLAIKFMNYLDENRPDGKMSLSNAECKDIDKAFKENDWEKIVRYADKYSWKPSEEQMRALEECGECKRCVKELYEQLKKLM